MAVRVNHVTLQQIADRVGCSRPVVSKVINDARGQIGVSDQLRRRIERTARELEYNGNYHALSLRTGRAGIIGMVFGRGPGVHTGFAGPLVDGLDVGVRAGGSDLMVVGPGVDEPELQRALRYLKQRKIDALCVPAYVYNAGREDPRFQALPVVTMLAAGKDLPTHVDVDLGPGTAQLMEHLAALGHRRVLWVADGNLMAARRELAARSAAAAHLAMDVASLKIRPIDPGRSWVEGQLRNTASAFKDWLDHNEPPTAIVAADEKLAFGICRALRQAGLSAPEDVSVASFDDIRAVLCDPPLTVVSQQMGEMGQAAAQLALQMAENPGRLETLSETRLEVPARLVVRDSTALPRT